MKDFIVLIAILPIMLIFIMQSANDAVRNEKINIIQDRIYSAKEIAKQRGEFDSELTEETISDLAEALKIPRDDIKLKVSEGKKDRFSDDKLITYRLEVRINDVMAGASLFGISEEDNSFNYVIDSFTASEYVSHK